MGFNKYTIAMGTALSFLVASLNAENTEECPVDHDKITKNCLKIYNDMHNLSDEEKANPENSKVEKYKESFNQDPTSERPPMCEAVLIKNKTMVHAKCERFSYQTHCEGESTSCEWAPPSVEDGKKVKGYCQERTRKKIKWSCLGQ